MGRSGRALAWGLAGLVTGVLGAAAAGLGPRGLAGLVAVVVAVLAVHAALATRARGFALPAGPVGGLPSRPLDRVGTMSWTGIGLVLGAAAFVLALETQVEDRWPVERAGERVEFEARVLGLPTRRGDRIQLQVRPLSDDLPRTLELNWFRPSGWPRPGELWRFSVRLMPPVGLRNPGGWDRERAQLAARIGGEGRVRSAEWLAPGDWRSAMGRLRQDLGDWLQASVHDLRSAALLRALVVGDRSAIDRDLSEVLRTTGTAHLLAISGLHVSLVAGFGALIGGILASWRPLRWIGPDRRRHALVSGWMAAVIYAALTGFALPAQRALVMLTVGLGAVLLRRSIAPGRALLVALAAVLLFDPLAPLSVGFWLSFAAVAVLIWSFAGRPPGGAGGLGLVRAQLVLGIGMLPLNLGLFKFLAPSALPANLLAIPLVTFAVLPFGLLAVGTFLAGFPEFLPLALAGLAGEALTVLVNGLEWAAEQWPAVRRLGTAGWPEIALAGVGVLWLLAPPDWPLRPLGLVLLVPLLAARPEPLPDGGFEVHVLDVGDGQAILVRTRESSLLYGTGPGDGEASSLIPGTIAPALAALGVDEPDRIVVPGRARGQAGGLAEARRRWPEAEVIGRHPALEAECRAGQEWSVDGVRFRFLHPEPALPELGGDDDCVLLIASTAGRVLLPGRVSRPVFDRLGRGFAPLDLLVLPRQGHRDALDLSWYRSLGVGRTVVSVDRANRWGLPHPVWQGAIEDDDVVLRSTADCGAMSLRLAPGQTPAFHTAVAGRERWRVGSGCPYL
jgi:competence protein ComEC